MVQSEPRFATFKEYLTYADGLEECYELVEGELIMTQRRLTITLDMPPPQLVAEVVSPGQTNREHDYNRKRNQYAARGIPEYWIIDPEAQTMMVLQLKDDVYIEVGIF